MPNAFHDFDRVWLLTWTTYATWLPGDERGFVSPKFDGPRPEARHNTMGTPHDANRPELKRLVQAKVIGAPVLLNVAQALILKQQFIETAEHRRWTIVSGAIMSNRRRSRASKILRS